jgi:hypothetical protein
MRSGPNPNPHLEAIFAELDGVTQPRVCMWHGCLKASAEHIVTIQKTSPTKDATYVNVEPSDIDSTFVEAATTMHWLWRLQDSADDSGQGSGKDGVSFDLFTMGSETIRVYVRTKQEYEPIWIIGTWFLFTARFVVFLGPSYDSYPHQIHSL